MHRLAETTIARLRDISIRRHAMRVNLRACLETKGFVEIPTSIIRPTDQDKDLLWNSKGCKIRPCMELQLRSALIYGLPSVYEMGPSFREGDISSNHYPEFQLVETFSSNMHFEEMVALSQDMLEAAFSRKIHKFKRIDVSDALQANDPNLDLTSSDDELLAYLKGKHPRQEKVRDAKYAYQAMNQLVEMVVEETNPGSIDEPVMLWRYPLCTVCLAKPIDSAPHLIQRAEFFIKGLEVGHGFVDDIDAESVEERMLIDKDHHDPRFLQLLKNKRLPPSAGVGFGLDRLLKIDFGIDDIKECIHDPCW